MRRSALLALAGVASVLPMAAQAADKPLFSAEQKTAIEAIVKDYIMAHPEVVVDSVNAHMEKQAAQQQEDAKKNIKKKADVLFKDDSQPFAGNENGDVVVVEFFDYQCGYCKKALPGILDLLAKDKGVKLVLRDFPILGPESETAAKAALAAQKQGKYFEFHQALLKTTGRLDDKGIEKAAKSLGLDMDKFKADMDAPEIADRIAQNRELGMSIGIQGTPAFVVGEKLVGGFVDEAALKALVAEQRKGQKK